MWSALYPISNHSYSSASICHACFQSKSITASSPDKYMSMFVSQKQIDFKYFYMLRPLLFVPVFNTSSSYSYIFLSSYLQKNWLFCAKSSYAIIWTKPLKLKKIETAYLFCPSLET